MNNIIRSLQEEKSSVQLESWISSILLKYNHDLESKLDKKVDNDVLEELVKHLATREELRKVVKKKMNSLSEKRSLENIRSSENIKNNILDELDENKFNLAAQKKFKKELEVYLADQIHSLEKRIGRETFSAINDSDFEKRDFQSIKKFTENLVDDKMKLILNSQTRARKEGTFASDDEIDILEQKMRREFDEKLFLLCSDLSQCKSILASQLYEPFHRCAQWIWKSGHLKLGSAVPWNIQTRNTGIFFS